MPSVSFAWNCIKNSCHPTYLCFQLKTQTGASACYIGPWLVHTDLSHLLGSLPKSYLAAGSLYLFTIGLSNVRVDFAQDQSNRLGIRLRLLCYSKKLSQRILVFSPPMSTKNHPFPNCVCKHQTGKNGKLEKATLEPGSGRRVLLCLSCNGALFLQCSEQRRASQLAPCADTALKQYFSACRSRPFHGLAYQIFPL